MRISPLWWRLAMTVGLTACAAGESLLPPDEVDPLPLTVTPIDMHTMQVRWTPVTGARVYELERRSNLKGAFELILGNIPKSQTNYLDRQLDPATIYGYRLTAYNDLGQRLGVTPVGGGETAPEPGIEVRISSVLGGDPARSIDSGGYRITVKGGAVSQVLPVEAQGVQVFQPLPAGLYSVGVEDIAPNCALEGANPRVVTVTDQGLATIAKASFVVNCRDRSRGRLIARVTTSGDTTDANGFKVVLSGLADDASLPQSERAVVLSRDVGKEGGQVLYDNLRPGTYSLVADNIAAFCTVDGTRQRDGIRVTPLSDLREDFKIDCSQEGGTASRPFIFEAKWNPDIGSTGSRTVLGVTLDVRQDPAADVRAFQFVMKTPAAVVRLDSVVSGTAGWSLTVNPNQGPGEFLALATRTTSAKGVVPLINAHYTIVGATGDKAPTRTIGLTVGAPDGSALDDRIRRVEDTLTVGTSSPPPPPTNQPPAAVANGPYAGSVGQAINLTAAGSADPDGSITAYAWEFGDGQSGTGQTASHLYSATGSYTATLVVTDNQGAKDTAQATVTVNGGGGSDGSTPFVWGSTFGALNAGAQTVPLNISLDLRTDIPETPGQEQLQDWAVDSLKWNPGVLQFFAFNRTSGTGSVNFTQALSRGVLIFRGSVAPSQSSGLVSIASVVLKVIGSAGQQSPITTYLGAVAGPPTTGSFSYRSRIKVEDPTYTVGGGGGPATTTVAGRVTSPELGSLAGARVSLSGGGPSATTAANGSYTVTGVASGSYSVSVTNLPATCTAPAARSITVATTPLTGIDFTVTCQAPVGTTTVAGSVTTPTGGAGGATVTLTPGNLSAVTSAGGAFTIGGVAPGPYTATVSNVPSGCQIPPTQSVTVASTPVTGVNFSLTCTAPPATGTVAGSITFAASSATPALTAVVVTVTPTGGSALTTNPNASNQYTRTGVPVAGGGGGTVSLTNLPAGCTGTTTVNYTGLTGGGTATAPAIQLTCVSAPPATKYPFTLSWGAIAAGKVTMTVKIDMAAINDPANNGSAPDRIGAFQGTLNFPASRLSNAACNSGSGFSGVLNTASAGGVTAVVTNTTGAPGVVTLFTCTFDVAGTGPTTPTWAAGSLLFGDQTGFDFGSKVDVIIASLP